MVVIYPTTIRSRTRRPLFPKEVLLKVEIKVVLIDIKSGQHDHFYNILEQKVCDVSTFLKQECHRIRKPYKIDLYGQECHIELGNHIKLIIMARNVI